MYNNQKGGWVLIIFLLCGLVIGGFLGTYLGGVEFLSWINYDWTFSMDTLSVDIKVIKLLFGLSINISIASIMGIAIAILLYRKIR